MLMLGLVIIEFFIDFISSSSMADYNYSIHAIVLILFSKSSVVYSVDV